MLQSHVTHHAALCKEGSVAVAAAVAAALAARAAGSDDLRGAVLQAVGAVTSYGEMLAAMLAAAGRGGWEAAVEAMYAARPPPAEFLATSPFKPPSITMFPPHTAGWAIFAAISGGGGGDGSSPVRAAPCGRSGLSPT